MIIPQTVFEVYEPGVYLARLESIEPVDGQFGQQLKIKFFLEGGHPLTVWTSLAFSQKSRLGQLAKAAFGRDIPADYALDTGHLIGRKLRLLVTVEERGDGSTYNKVSLCLPVASTPAPAPKPPPAPSPFDDGGVFDDAPPVDERIPF